MNKAMRRAAQAGTGGRFGNAEESGSSDDSSTSSEEGGEDSEEEGEEGEEEWVEGRNGILVAKK